MREKWTLAGENSRAIYTLIGNHIYDSSDAATGRHTLEELRAQAFIEILTNIMDKTVEQPPGWTWLMDNGAE